MTDPRTMLSFLTGTHRFNYRVAGVALRDSHVLVCREDDEDFVMLPGGRVELGEPSEVALRREINEELQCTGQIDRLLFTVENFFARGGEQFHEIALYYAISLPDSFPFEIGRPSLITHDEGHVLTIDWVPAHDEVLTSLNLLPEWIRPRFGNLPNAPDHLIVDER